MEFFMLFRKSEKTAMPDTVPIVDARMQLSRLWFLWAFFLSTVLILQSILGHFTDQVKEVWSWYIPTIVPTLSLMIGVLGASALGTEEESRIVRRGFFNITYWISAGYLLILTVTVILEPLTPMKTIELYLTSNYWLSPFQSLSGTTIALLFTSQKTAPPKDGTVPPPAPDNPQTVAKT